MSPRTLHYDMESRSVCELKDRGLYVYAADPTTDVWCVAWAFDDGPIELWRRGEPCPAPVAEHILAGGELAAHNSAFERVMHREILGPRYGWPVPRLEAYRCTMTQAYAMSLPGSLESAGAALGLDTTKDMAGRRLALQMARPRRVEPDGTPVWWDGEDRLSRLYEYCKTDVAVEREVDRRTLRLSAAELALWHLDQRINDRGVFVDVRLCRAAKGLVRTVTEALDKDMRAVTGGAVSRCSNVQELIAFVRAGGVDADSVAKDKLADLLIRDDLPPAVRQALELRQEAAKTSTAKIDAMLLRVNADGRMRGNLQFHGANTGRWAARGAQLQNLPRPTIVKSATEADDDEVRVQRQAIEAIHSGDPALIEMLFGAPLTVVADCVRGIICAPKGRAITAGDFSAIEGRGIAWLAGQHDKLDVFARGEDIYKQQASVVFGIPAAQIGKGPKRQIGKVSELACGFGGGVGAFLAMARTYALKIGDHYDEIWAVMQPQHREKALGGWADRGKRSGVAERTWLAAEVVKIAWRQANPEIARYWLDLEDAAIAAVREPGRTFPVGKRGNVKYRKAGSFLFCQLPSGRVLTYPYPRVEMRKTPWGAEKPQLLYKFVDQFTRKWTEGATYGGSLSENVTSGTCRDLMAEAMLRADEAGYSLVLTVHDELVSDDPEDFGSAEDFRRLMEIVPPWAEGFPIAASVYRASRYRK